MRGRPERSDAARRRGPEDLLVLRGTVVGVHGEDVFVDLGPRKQGVISRREFAEPPLEGDVFDFTQRGREEGLWVLSLRTTGTLVSWEKIETGSLVQARVTGRNPGGLDLKVGPLHAFMPRSQVGVPREQKLDVFLGRTLTVEVIEVDDARQRVVVSRKVVVQRERESQIQRLVGALEPGQEVSGRVSRIEPYGAFVDFGHGLQGLVHVRDLANGRIGHPSEVVKKGEHVTVKVLTVKAGGKRIGLGLKQMERSPWLDLAGRVRPGQIVSGTVAHLAGFGAFVEVLKGVEGLLHVSETGLDDARRLREVAPEGRRLSVRVLALDPERERLSLSLLHEDGQRIHPEEAERLSWFAAAEAERAASAADAEDLARGTNLGRLVRDALRRPPRADRDAG